MQRQLGWGDRFALLQEAQDAVLIGQDIRVQVFELEDLLLREMEAAPNAAYEFRLDRALRLLRRDNVDFLALMEFEGDLMAAEQIRQQAILTEQARRMFRREAGFHLGGPAEGSAPSPPPDFSEPKEKD